MVKYLENDICNFKCLFDLDPNIKKNIISISFFKMYNGGYKDFNLYIQGFKKLYKIVMDNKYDYTIRLFIDNSIYNDKSLFNQLNGLERVDIIIYDCPKYIESENNNYHIGLFGTMVRFFPLFDFPNNDANIVQIMDMDDYLFFLDNQKVIDIVEKYIDKIYLVKYGALHKNPLYTTDLLIDNIINPYVIAPKYIIFKQLNKNIFLNFFKEIDSEKNKGKLYTLYKDKISNKMIENNGKFIYGIDEYFLNINLSNYIINNKIPFAVKYHWVINGNLYYILKKKHIVKKELNLLNLMINYILDKSNIKYDKNMNINKKYKLIDDNLYKNNKDKENILFYFYKSFLYFLENKNYKFLYDIDLYKIIKDNNLFGIYEFECIKYYFTKNIPLQIIKKKIFKEEELERLKIFSKKHAKIFV